MISVIIPTYNRSALIERAINSVLCQTFQDIELIIVDDASTDDTEAVVKGISDKRLRYCKLPTNGGAAAARNYGVAQAAGEYVAFQDSDDEWLPTKLEKQMAAIEASGCDVCITRFERKNYPKEFPLIVPEPSTPAGMIDYERVVRGGLVSTQTILAKKEVFESVSFDEDLRYCEDLEWSYRAFRKYTLCLVDDILVRVYLQPDSMTQVNFSRRAKFHEKEIADFKRDWSTNETVRDLVYQSLLQLAVCRELQGFNAPGCYWRRYRMKKDRAELKNTVLSLTHQMRRRRMQAHEVGDLPINWL